MFKYAYKHLLTKVKKIQKRKKIFKSNYTFLRLGVNTNLPITGQTPMASKILDITGKRIKTMT